VLQLFFKDSFRLSTLLLFGAIAQILTSAILPARYSIVPVAILVLNAIVKTVIQALSPNSNSFMSDVIPHIVSAQFPDPETARYGAKPASKSFVVLHLGIRFNHPLGLFAPGARETGDYFLKMMTDLYKRQEEYGMLSATTWSGAERASNNTLLYIYYFRDIEGLNKFAHDPLHTQATTWIRKEGIKHIAIFHEAFCSAPGTYESVYYNSNPLLMGMADVKCVDEDSGEEKFVNPLVYNNVSRLRSQYSRMGRTFNDCLDEKA
jgi:fumagillin biosynthesis monooxygenase